MSNAMLARVAARAASLRADKAANWQTVAQEAPPFAAFANGLRRACGEKVNAVVYKGNRYGDDPLPDRRVGVVPPIPGVRR